MQPAPEADSRGVLVAEVVPNGPAAAAGMQGADVIVTVGGQIVRDSEELRAALATLQAGQTVPVVVLRDGEERILQVTLGRRPGRSR